MQNINVKREVPIEIPRDCRECDHRYGNMCRRFGIGVAIYDNGSDDLGFIHRDECKQAEVKDEHNRNCV